MTLVCLNTELSPIREDKDKSKSKDKSEKSEGQEPEDQDSDEDQGDSDEDSDEGDSDEGDSDEDSDEDQGDSDSGDQDSDEEGSPDSEGEGDSDDDSDDGEGDSDEGSPDSEGDSDDGDQDSNDQDSEGEGDSEEGPEEEKQGLSNGKPQAGGAGGKQASSYTGDALKALLELLAKGNNPLKDVGNALTSALISLEKDECVKRGEALWKPFSTTWDTVSFPKGDGPEARNIAQEFRKTVRIIVSSLTAALRTKFLAARSPKVYHGVSNGQDLSDPLLVETYLDIKAGARPKRPDWDFGQRTDCTLATALVLDQSGSMYTLVADVAKAALAMSEPLSNLGSPCLVIGPRNGGDGYMPAQASPSVDAGYHRTGSVHMDIFKDWDEKIANCAQRFTEIQAVGSTPLEDGIQYALREISGRKERHRVILVVTDGMPDNVEVVRRQIRIAAEAGIHIVGVGISSGCQPVAKLFKEYVVVPQIADLPTALLGVLTKIMFPKNARKVAF